MEEFLTHLTGQVAKTMPGIAAGISVFIGFWICSVLFKSFMAHVINHAPNDKKDVLNLLAKAGRIVLIVVGGIGGRTLSVADVIPSAWGQHVCN